MQQQQFIPSIPIEFCGPDGKRQTRNLRFDLAARRVLRRCYVSEDLEQSDPEKANEIVQKNIANDNLLFLTRAIYAMTYHERIEDEKPESFEPLIGIHNLEYIGKIVAEAMGTGNDDEPDPTTAPNGSIKPRTGKRSKRSQKSASASRQSASIQ